MNISNSFTRHGTETGGIVGDSHSSAKTHNRNYTRSQNADVPVFFQRMCPFSFSRHVAGP